MDYKQAFQNLLICAVIGFCVFRITERIHLFNDGRTCEGTIVEAQELDSCYYIRFKYFADGKEFQKSERMRDGKKYREGEKIPLLYLSRSPEEPLINPDKEQLNREVYYVLSGIFFYMIYRGVKITLHSTRPNWN